MNLLVLLITAFLLFALAITPVSAGPSPSDGGEGAAANPPDVLQTALFGLWEVDLSALGVSATELLTVGPQAELTAASGTGMLIVDDDLLDCPNAQFMTIQDAVAAAMPGDKIKVCPARTWSRSPSRSARQVNATADVSYNNARNNTNDGIVVFDDGTRENLISHNKAFENAVLDCHDESHGTHNGAALVANEWLKDLGRTENRVGLCKRAGPK